MARRITRNFDIYDVYAKIYNSDLDSVGEEFIGTFPYIPSRLRIKRLVELADLGNELINFRTEKRNVHLSVPSMIMVKYALCGQDGDLDSFKESFNNLLCDLYADLSGEGVFDEKEVEQRRKIMRTAFCIAGELVEGGAIYDEKTEA